MNCSGRLPPISRPAAIRFSRAPQRSSALLWIQRPPEKYFHPNGASPNFELRIWERSLMASFVRNTVRSLRSWRRTPGSALLVVFALGLSGGALIALVSLFNALFWRQLPVSHPEELVGVSAIERGMPDW